MLTLHLVSHTHWDREWYLTFQQFRLKLVHLIDGLLDILENDRQFRHFMLDGQTIVLDDYLAIRPEREADLRRYIKNGRILIGPWHILPDEFLVSPEATIHNLLQGDHTARKFGPKMMVGYIPDPFGHIGQMPQILRGFGIETACVQRGLADEPCEFWWEGPDGSRVFMAYLRDGYGNAASLPTSDPERFITEVKRLRDSLLPHKQLATRNSHFLLMHGTDHMQPPPETSRAIAYTKGKLDGDILVHSTLPAYIAAVQSAIGHQPSAIPTVIGELRSPKRSHLLPGVLSTRMWIKQRNRACETLLEKWAEPFTTFAAIACHSEPRSGEESHHQLQETLCFAQGDKLKNNAPILHQAWRLLMENHPHDSICGCSIDQVHDEMKVRFDQVEQIGEEITKQSLETLTTAIQTQSTIRNPQSAVVVFNPISGPRTDAVTAEITLPPNMDKFEINDESGTTIPYQIIGMGSRDLIRVALTARDLQIAFGNIHDGRAANIVIQNITVRREGAQIFIEAIVSDSGEPNIAAWKSGLQQIEAYFRDETITTYNVHAHTAAATRALFTAPEVPGYGWRTFYVHAQSGEEQPPARLPPLARLLLPLASPPFLQKLATHPRYKRAPQSIENEFFKVRVERDGTLTILATRNNLEYRGLNRFVDGADCGDEYNYCPPPSDRMATAKLKGVRVHSGAVQQKLEIHLELHLPVELSLDRKSRSRQNVIIPVTSHVSLITGVPRIDIQTEVENDARDHRLRVHFPAPFAATEADYDSHFEVVRRPAGVPAFDESWGEQPRPEVPQRVFTTISDGNNGLMIANRGLPEVEVLKRPDGKAEIALTLLRCVGWLSRDDFANRKGHAGPFLPTPGAQMLGKWVFEYSIIPHDVGRDGVLPYEQAYAFETPMRAVSTGLHDGTLPASSSFVEVSPQGFVLSAVKVAEDGKGWLVRGYNISGEEINVTLTPWRKFRRVARVNLVEEKHAVLKPLKDRSVTFAARGYEVVTVMFQE